MYNKTIILGRLTANPELKTTPSGISVTSFSVAVDRGYAPKGQEKAVDFFNVVAWRGTSEFICKYFSKGNPILIEGEMQSRKYTDKQGVERTVWELVADKVSFTGSKAENGSQGGTASPSVTKDKADVFVEIEDDEALPF